MFLSVKYLLPLLPSLTAHPVIRGQRQHLRARDYVGEIGGGSKAEQTSSDQEIGERKGGGFSKHLFGFSSSISKTPDSMGPDSNNQGSSSPIRKFFGFFFGGVAFWSDKGQNPLFFPSGYKCISKSSKGNKDLQLFESQIKEGSSQRNRIYDMKFPLCGTQTLFHRFPELSSRDTHKRRIWSWTVWFPLCVLLEWCFSF